MATGADRIRKRVWDSLVATDPSKLTFKMIMRLAEYIINSNPKIKQFLQETYHYVFLMNFKMQQRFNMISLKVALWEVIVHIPQLGMTSKE